MTETIAAIDVGTNSVHMTVARVDNNGFTVLTTEKEVVRLGEGAQGMDHLAEAAMERGVNAMSHMKRIASAFGATIRAVATSAVREAENQSEFLKAISENVGIDIEVISGSEEARLIFLGVSRSVNLTSDRVLVVDIGGGSTEFCLSANGNLKFAQSVKVGAVRMTDSFLTEGLVTESGVKKLRSKVQSALAPLVHDISQIGWDRVVLSSGTSEAIARMASTLHGNKPPKSLNGYEFSVKDLQEVVGRLLEHRTPQDRLDIDGLDPKRADIIPAGSVILQEIARSIRANKFIYSDFALREGVLIDTAQRMGVLNAEPVDAGQASALRLAERCSVDIAHGSHVADLSSKILVEVSQHFEIDTSIDRLLRTAALLARVGNSISYSKYHMHSFYIIRNADLMGFTDVEVSMIALVARYQRKGTPKLSHEEYAGLSETQQQDVELMSGILRIASGLDRTHNQCITDIGSSSAKGVLTLSVRHTCESDEVADLNIYTAQSRVAMLEEFLGERIVISR